VKQTSQAEQRQWMAPSGTSSPWRHRTANP
jgi:hypothetical protein